MKYNEKKIFIGASDIASLTLRSKYELFDLHFAEDGFYTAWLTDETAEIPTHYSKVFEGSDWLRVYDDEALIQTFVAKTISVYRAGERGVIIQLVN